MGIFSRKKRRPEIGLYGKHPTAGDFIRVNAASADLRSFDDWLSTALQSAERGAMDWPRAYGGAPSASFLFFSGAKGARCIIGSFAPSRDRSGRLFPLVLFAELDLEELAERFPSVPFHPFLLRARGMLDGRLSCTQDQLLSMTQRLAVDGLGRFDSVDTRTSRYLDGTRAGAAFGAMFGANSPQPPVALGEAVAICQGLKSGRFPRYGIRIPLSQPAAGRLVSGPSVEGNASFWLALLQRYSSVPVMPSAIWTDEALVIYFGPLGPRALATLWLPPVDDETICDLGRSAPSAQPLLPRYELPLRALLQ